MANPEYNFNGSNLSHWQTKLAAVRAGTDTATVSVIGDSMTAGSPGSKLLSYPERIVSYLNALGAPAQGDSFFCDAKEGAAYAAYDPRVTLGSGWSVFTAVPNCCIGGQLFIHNGTPTPFSFSPGVSADTFDVYYLQNADFTINVDGGVPLAIVTSLGTNTVAKITVSCTFGTHTLNIVPSTTNNTFVVGVVASDSSVKKIAVLGMGFGGAKAADWVDNTYTWTTYSAVTVPVPDLSLVMIGPNDWNSGTSPSAFKASMQTLIGLLSASGSVIIIVPTPTLPGTGFASTPTQNLYRQILYGLADANDIPLIDLFWAPQYGSAATADSNGLYYDNVHLQAAGYDGIAKIIAGAII